MKTYLFINIEDDLELYKELEEEEKQEHIDRLKLNIKEFSFKLEKTNYLLNKITNELL